ncbi:carboxypeptidase-like regulatory domain-containing protein [Schauerella aestuarii]|uniref:carboxypeptidase-like regulatory domain-containing protein n=1 Tax=Schauerella aestuarii TaxID=2511204 RepID=UPI00136E6670|nr:carboxypeptidase-like regulatory domain-containing protein [Achromobacter aestuarii]MYZ41395.1 carboxypeptidase regulatory-like domain-containing protein [Achromobacter aestuarii]
MRFLIAGVMVASLAGCITPPKPVERRPFVEAEFTKYRTPGTSTIKGQAFLTTRGGQVRSAAGNEVTLVPNTSISDQWIMVSCNGGLPLTPADLRYNEFVRRTVADADGRFSFAGLPAGSYVVTTAVMWSVPVSAYSTSTQGGMLVDRVWIEEGKEANLVLSQRNLCQGR